MHRNTSTGIRNWNEGKSFGVGEMLSWFPPPSKPNWSDGGRADNTFLSLEDRRKSQLLTSDRCKCKVTSFKSLEVFRPEALVQQGVPWGLTLHHEEEFVDCIGRRGAFFTHKSL
ncbi:unnamed protein product [Natator depressus]